MVALFVMLTFFLFTIFIGNFSAKPLSIGLIILKLNFICSLDSLKLLLLICIRNTIKPILLLTIAFGSNLTQELSISNQIPIADPQLSLIILYNTMCFLLDYLNITHNKIN